MNVAFPASTLAHLKRRYFRSEPGFFGGRGPRAGRPTASAPGSAGRLWRRPGSWRRAPGDLVGLERFLLNLLHELAARSPRAPLAGCPAWLREACERLAEPEHLAGGVQSLAELAGRSPEHVARQLRACAGLRPVDLVTRRPDRPRHDPARVVGDAHPGHRPRVRLRQPEPLLPGVPAAAGRDAPRPIASAARPPSAERRRRQRGRRRDSASPPAARPLDASSVCHEVSLRKNHVTLAGGPVRRRPADVRWGRLL